MLLYAEKLHEICLLELEIFGLCAIHFKWLVYLNKYFPIMKSESVRSVIGNLQHIITTLILTRPMSPGSFLTFSSFKLLSMMWVSLWLLCLTLVLFCLLPSWVNEYRNRSISHFEIFMELDSTYYNIDHKVRSV